MGLLKKDKSKKSLQKGGEEVENKLRINISKKILNILEKCREEQGFRGEMKELNDKYDILHMEFDKLKTYNYISNNNKMELDLDNKSIEQYSFHMISNNNNNKFININYLYTLFSNNDMTEFLPDFLVPNNIFIAYLDKIIFTRFRGVINFVLYRLKLNNIFYIKTKIKNKNDNSEIIESFKYKLPIEEITRDFLGQSIKILIQTYHCYESILIDDYKKKYGFIPYLCDNTDPNYRGNFSILSDPLFA